MMGIGEEKNLEATESNTSGEANDDNDNNSGGRYDSDRTPDTEPPSEDAVPPPEEAPSVAFTLPVNGNDDGVIDGNGDDDDEESPPSAPVMVPPVSNYEEGPEDYGLPQPSPQERRRSSHLSSGSRNTSYKTKSGATKASRRLSSMEMRRLPIHVLLEPAAFNDGASVLSDEFLKEEGASRATDDDDQVVGGSKKDWLHMLCLRPGYTLRTQLMLGFGTISFLTIAAVVVTCIAVATLAGKNVKDTSREAFSIISHESQRLTSRYLAESLTEKILLTDVVKLLVEATQDRFAGYPDLTSPENDYLPFVDSVTGEHRYPLDVAPPPFEWQFEPTVNAENFDEHFVGREYFKTKEASTASAMFAFKGVCDPDETDPLSPTFWPNCTDANNDISTGGVIQPVNTTQGIYDRAKDMAPLLKAIFETRHEIRDIGLYFANSGAGALISYPHYPISTHSVYTSTGCDWMNTPNYYDPSRTIGTPEMIARCHPKDEIVSSRVYSAMERDWCVDQALHPNQMRFSAGLDAWDNNFWMLVMGQSIYDRVTNEFIACMYTGISFADIDEELRNATVVKGETILLLQWDEEGTVIGSSLKDRDDLGAAAIADTGLGVSEEDYETVYNMIDFDSVWDPQEVKERYSNLELRDEQYFVTMYPMPPIPDTYDETYEPLFLVVVSTPIEAVYEAVEDASDVVDDRVRDVNVFSITTGAIGLVISFLIIFMMANMLTMPLRTMNKVASEIVRNFGDPTRDKEIGAGEEKVSREARCTPRTELSDVVDEFNKMVASFSGSSMAKTERHQHHEVYNMFTLHNEFSELYASRGDQNFLFSLDQPKEHESKEEWADVEFLNRGSNIPNDQETLTTTKTGARDGTKMKTFSSSLFIWIVALIVTPLLLVNIVITVVSLHTVSSEFTQSMEQAKGFFLDVEMEKLSVHSQLRAKLVSGLTKKASADIHILTRYASWSLFGGIKRADSFTEMMSGIEECRSYDDLEECPFIEEESVCDCLWNDTRSVNTCSVYPEGSRLLQELFWVCESRNTDEDGDRMTTSFPEFSTSPQTTAWWDDQLTVPGYMNASLESAGHNTTFERLQAAASIPLFQALFNYHETKDTVIGFFIGFEADGLFMGYDGCLSSLHPNLMTFQSTVGNGAADLRPELCPLGKFGYDPRCRGWYDAGRTLALYHDTYLHITSPYEFATTASLISYAQSATTALIDPKTGEHVGQVLFDFQPTAIYHALNENTPLAPGGYPVLISVESGSDEDTIVGPGYNIGDPPTAIAAKVLPFDVDTTCGSRICEENRYAFDEVVRDMKNGGTGIASFYRSSSSGNQEIVHIAYAPVLVDNFQLVDSSDFSRGLIESEYPIYSLALAETEAGMLKDFDPIEKEITRQINIAIGMLTAVLVVATLAVVYISFRVTESITEPMVYLLDIIWSIRKADSKEAPDLRRVKASQEIVAFSDSIEMLSKVVRSANTAFYAGEFERAYYVLVDALRLFRRLGNKKAIGIASNNLGNIMMGMYQEMEKDDVKKLAGLTKRQIVTKGITYYHEAITLGEKAYDEFYALHGWTPICLDFMQHLSNRYFNRGLFLLCVKDYHEHPDKIEELGRRDLQIASDMDSEVIAYGEEIGWDSYDRVEKMFEVKIVRANGYNLLLNLGLEFDTEANDLLEDAFDIIKHEKKQEESELFMRVSYPGRLQEIETELMKYNQSSGDLETAAKVAIRCLYEDEKVFVDTHARAIDVLCQYTEKNPDMGETIRGRVKSSLEDYTDMLEDAVDHQCRFTISDMDSDVVTKATHGSSGNSRRYSSKNWSLRQSCGRFVTMEDF